MTKCKIEKTHTGYSADCGGTIATFIMHYDKNGVYTCQTQDDMLGDAGYRDIYPQIIDGKPYVNGEPVSPLTAEEMASAT